MLSSFKKACSVLTFLALLDIEVLFAHADNQYETCATIPDNAERLDCFDNLGPEESKPQAKKSNHRIVGGYCYEPLRWKKKPGSWLNSKSRFAIAEIAKDQNDLNLGHWNNVWDRNKLDQGVNGNLTWIYPELPPICRCSQMHASIQNYIKNTDCFISIKPQCDELVSDSNMSNVNKADARIFFGYQCNREYSRLY